MVKEAALGCTEETVGRVKPVTLGGISFPRKGDARAYLKEMLNKYAPGQVLSEDDAAVLRDALQHHPNGIDKIGVGVSGFIVRSAEYGTQCFWVTRVDGTTERFSYKSCV